ncbi:YeeE/YedE thiosulfate transporter family protein [Undibacterium sp. Ji67W]|uniref:YeeE/YedE thiosulfate transporter family protein n=1 Tax=Undibacterium sp. Ji67W TaxID=3413042 RepID=UPI003BF2F841
MNSLFFILAVIAVGIMGFAVQRGATCSVAAVDEIVQARKIKRLTAMFEAAIWVAVGLGVAEHFHVLNHLPGGYEITPWTLIGAVMLGLGAFINGGCVFGGIAKLGSGKWAYAFMPLGYYLGCLSMPALFDIPVAIPKPSSTSMSFAASLALWPLTILLVWRITGLLLDIRSIDPSSAIQWSPHVATIMIGFTFLVSMLLAGKWAYTEVLADLAQGMMERSYQRIILALALFLGCFVGGLTAGRFSSTKPSLTSVLRCLAGGMMMAWGSLLIPGSNDGLLLIGMPLLWPYAWVAFLVMCGSIAMAQILKRRFSG